MWMWRYFKMLSLLFILFFVGVSNGAPILEDEDLSLYGIFSQSDPGEYGTKFEGDMVLSRDQMRAISVAQVSRNGLIYGTKRWPDNVVVYDIIEDDFDEKQIKMIMKGFAEITKNSCIKFRPRNGFEHAVRIMGTGIGCYSNVGFQNDPQSSQDLNLSNGCFLHGIILHEMLHTIGFFHMQSTYDRDDFVKIMWENILRGQEHNFVKYNTDTVTDFGVPYDYKSVMHYAETAFSSNGKRTIVPLQDYVQIGQRDGLSKSDILKLNRMYCKN